MSTDRPAPRSRPRRDPDSAPAPRRPVDPLRHLSVILKRDELNAERQWVTGYLADHELMPVDLAAALVYLVRALDEDMAGNAPRPPTAPRANPRADAGRTETGEEGYERPAAPRRPAREAQRDRDTGTATGFNSYRINVGEDEGLRTANVLAVLANEGGLDGSQVGRIRIAATSSTVELSDELGPEEIEELGKLRFKGRPFGLEPARAAAPRPRRAPGEERPARPRAAAARPSYRDDAAPRRTAGERPATASRRPAAAGRAAPRDAYGERPPSTARRPAAAGRAAPRDAYGERPTGATRRSAGPRAAGPRPAGPRAPGARPAGPRAAERPAPRTPRSGEARTTASRPAAARPRPEPGSLPPRSRGGPGARRTPANTPARGPRKKR